MSNTRVLITFVPVEFEGEITRSFTLSEQNPSVIIGRSSKREARNRSPSHENFWFDSRVMSRDHAELIFCNKFKTVYLRDMISTHGTYINNQLLTPDERETLLDGDTVRFGVDVDRGDEEFPALNVRCQIDCLSQVAPKPSTIENPAISSSGAKNLTRPTSSSNTFSVPEDSDVEEVSATKVNHETRRENAKPASQNSHTPVSPISNPHGIIDLDCNPAGQRAPPLGTVPKNAPVATTTIDLSEDGEDNSRDADSCLSPGYLSSEMDISDEESDVGSPYSPSPSSDGADVTQQNTSAPGVLSETSESDSEAECIDPSVLNPSVPTQSIPNGKCNSETVHHEKTAGGFANEPIKEKAPNPFISPPPKLPFAPLPPWIQPPGMGYGPPPPPLPTETMFTPPPPWAYRSYGRYNDVSQYDDSLDYDDEPRYDEDSQYDDGYQYDDGPFCWRPTPAPRIPQPVSGPLQPATSTSVHGSLPNKDSKPTSEVALEKEPVLKKSDEETLRTPDMPTMKRKASQLEPNDVQQDVKLAKLDNVPQSEVASAIFSALSEADTGAEPPQKRAKTTPPMPKNLTGLAATVVVSAMLGSLGTIALLAALPAGYFQ
ncbi:hypothetical protein N7532_004217 [Penicillium argentinense]|uniref:FHA domain-containing protein n=1 Tax=Penicillium argentinense TaxID=1131581 RepID=A0A9W9FNZ3_9EURO|nr:uncharacterized protein N7532_004217 [Penicillium argentinense]KAJ5103688.1 hypothetical protein N7532_004217 [Penicillium argentinense]